VIFVIIFLFLISMVYIVRFQYLNKDYELLRKERLELKAIVYEQSIMINNLKTQYNDIVDRIKAKAKKNEKNIES